MNQRSNVRYRSSHILQQFFIVGVTLTAAVIVMIPVVWMVSAAIRPISEILNYPPHIIPQDPTLRFFSNILSDPIYQRYFINSTIVSVLTLVGTIGLGSLAAYGFSRSRIAGARWLLIGILALLMLPRVALIVPYFRLAHLAGLHDTLFGLVLVNTAFLLPIAIWLLKGYMDTIPVALEEAAMIDGCSHMQALRKVTLPLSVPGLVGVGTFVFIGAWNEYLLAIVLTDSPESRTLTIGLASFFGEYVRDWNSIMALATMSSVPLVLIFIFLQRWVVTGMARGAVK